MDLDAPIGERDRAVGYQGGTVRQVLGMRGGFPLDPIDKALEAVEGDLDRSWTTDEFLALVDAEGPRQGPWVDRRTTTISTPWCWSC